MSTPLNLAEQRLEFILYYKYMMKRNKLSDQNAAHNLKLECNAYLFERLKISCHFKVTEYHYEGEIDVYYFDYYKQEFNNIGQYIACYHRTGKYLGGFYNCTDNTFKWEVVGE